MTAIAASPRASTRHSQRSASPGIIPAASTTTTNERHHDRSIGHTGVPREYSTIQSINAGRYSPAFGFKTTAAPANKPIPAAAASVCRSRNRTASQAARPTQTTMNVSQTLRSRKP
jgi:hypothetical protein